MSTLRLLAWLLAAVAAVAWLSIVLAWPPPASSPACLAGLDTLETLPGTPRASLLDQVEAACGQ